MSVCVGVNVCVCARARERVCGCERVCVCEREREREREREIANPNPHTHTHIHIPPHIPPLVTEVAPRSLFMEQRLQLVIFQNQGIAVALLPVPGVRVCV